MFCVEISEFLKAEPSKGAAVPELPDAPQQYDKNSLATSHFSAEVPLTPPQNKHKTLLVTIHLSVRLRLTRCGAIRFTPVSCPNTHVHLHIAHA